MLTHYKFPWRLTEQGKSIATRFSSPVIFCLWTVATTLLHNMQMFAKNACIARCWFCLAQDLEWLRGDQLSIFWQHCYLKRTALHRRQCHSLLEPGPPSMEAIGFCWTKDLIISRSKISLSRQSQYHQLRNVRRGRRLPEWTSSSW